MLNYILKAPEVHRRLSKLSIIVNECDLLVIYCTVPPNANISHSVPFAEQEGCDAIHDAALEYSAFSLVLHLCLVLAILCFIVLIIP